MKRKFLTFLLITMILCGSISDFLKPVIGAPRLEVSPQDLISLINGMRTAQGLPALTVNSILMSTAQQTSDIMALNDLHAHIGNVSGRVMDAGYGGGAIAWATENFAIGPMTISQIQAVWADPDHMIPVVNANYKDIGAGVTEYNGRVWYIVHAAYTSGGTYVQPTSVSGTAEYIPPPVSQIIIPVQTVTPNPEGAVIHEVQNGQALWSIAIAYGTKIEELVRLNNLSAKDPIIYPGQKLLVFEAKFTSTPTLEASATADPDKTKTPEVTATAVPTRTKTKPASTATSVIITPSMTPLTVTDSPKYSEKMFENSSIGIVLVSALAFGILLVITGSFSKIKKN
jgi:LysM repeat protein